MSKTDPTQTSFNAGPQPDKKERAPELAGNVAEQGEDPSPDDRERGETSDKD